MTAPPPPEKLRGLTYASIRSEAREELDASWDTWNKVMAGLIVLLVGGLYLYFSFWLR
jgi:solute:Na+ symporter, SSS family